MTIEVKSSRQPLPDEQPRKRFDFFAREKTTSLPVHIGLAVVALAVYFRHLLSHEAAKNGPEDREAGGEHEAAPMSARMRRAGKDERDAQEPAAESKRSIAELDPYDPKSETDWSPSILVSDQSGKLRFTRPHVEFQPISVFPAAYGVQLSNDNVPRRPTAHPFIPHPIDPLVSEPDSTDAGPQKPEEDQDDEDDHDGDGRANRAPITTGPVRLNDIIAGQAILIGLTHLLAGAYDPDGDMLLVGDVNATGLDVLPTASGWTMRSEHGMLGPVTLSYMISDGQASVWQMAHFDIVRNTVTLTPGDDVFVGTAYDDDIDAGAGDDIVNAMAGHDLVVGGPGDDHLFGDDGDDVLHGGAGMDVIFGGNGNDIIHGGEDNDRLFGEGGADTLFGDAGDDWIEGGKGDDILDGGSGNDDLFGGEGRDRLSGAEGDDNLSGGVGNDALDGGEGSDTLSGGEGDDVLVGGEGDDAVEGESGDDTVVGGGGNDAYDGGTGYDVLDYSASAEGLIIDDRTGEASGAQIGEDVFTGFEQINGGTGDDLFVIGASARVISGGRGRDMFIFEVTDENPSLSEDIVHDILDFVVGDRIRVRDYDISREARAAERDLFRSIYGDDNDDWLRADIPILVTHDTVEGFEKTIIHADFNGDDVTDVTISIRNVLLAWTNDPVSA